MAPDTTSFDDDTASVASTARRGPTARQANPEFSPRRAAPSAGEDVQATLRREAKGREIGPCVGCGHAERCRDGLACVALELLVNTGRSARWRRASQIGRSISGCTGKGKAGRPR
jgi:hypothetical protein